MLFQSEMAAFMSCLGISITPAPPAKGYSETKPLGPLSAMRASWTRPSTVTLTTELPPAVIVLTKASTLNRVADAVGGEVAATLDVVFIFYGYRGFGGLSDDVYL